MKKYIFIILTFVSINTYAQKSVDAYRYSQSNTFSTARSAGLAGAFGALGGDFSSLRINPAGLGFYRHHEFSLTNGITSVNMNQDLTIGNGADLYIDKNKTSYNLANVGIVLALNNKDMISDGWNGINIGLGYNKINNFNRNSFTNDYNAGTSFLEYTSFFAYGTAPDDLYGTSDKLFYDSKLIREAGFDEYGNQMYGIPLEMNEKINQFNTVHESGYQGEYVISFATNYKRKLFLGGSIGIQVLDYSSTSVYSEETLEGTTSDLNDYSFIKNLNQTGYGVNIKLGAIYKPTENLSLGLAYHTSTELHINEEYYSSVIANYNILIDESKRHESKSRFNEFDYELSTPGKLILSGAYVFGQKGFISTDIEFINYGGSRFSVDNDKNIYSDLNFDIDKTYDNVINFRIGGEYRLNSLFSLRAGYAYEDSPYKSGSINDSDYNRYMETQDIIGTPYQSGYINNNDFGKNIFTGGLGFRVQNLYANFAYIYTMYDNSHHSYYFDNGNTYMESTLIKQDVNTHDFMLSIGVNF